MRPTAACGSWHGRHAWGNSLHGYAHLPVLTKLTQSPWFLNVRGKVKVCQAISLHWSLVVGGPMPGVNATPTGADPTGIVVITILAAVSITHTESDPKLAA